MLVVRKSDRKSFRAVDGSEVREIFGLPTTGTQELSLAVAKLKRGSKTIRHKHSFIEIYVLTKGNGVMYIDGSNKKVKKGDNILIPKGAWHWIENTGKTSLELWCICAPAFTPNGTTIDEAVTSRH